MITKKTTSSRATLMPDGTTTMYTVHITADTAADIPTPEKDWDAGSRCDVLEDGGKTYLLNNAGQWEEVHFFGNGGGTAPVDAYTKAETDELLGQKADKSEVTESVTAAVAQIVANAPEDFDTLRELYDWLTQHEDSAAAMNTAILQNAADIETLETQKTEQAEAISAVTEEATLNSSTLGYQRKNLLPFPERVTKGGITFVCDKNGYMSSNNTEVDARQWTIGNSQYSVDLKPGVYTLSFVSKSVCTNLYGNIEVLSSDNMKIADIGQTNYANKTIGSVTFTIKSEQTVYVMAKIFNGITALMLRYAEITDDTYEPYKPSVQEQIDALINRISALESSQIDMVTSKNMADEIITMNVEDEKHERTENLEQTD